MAVRKIKVLTTLVGPEYHIRKGETTTLDSKHADGLAKAGLVEIVKQPASKKK